jgi:hypothetical protein
MGWYRPRNMNPMNSTTSRMNTEVTLVHRLIGSSFNFLKISHHRKAYAPNIISTIAQPSPPVVLRRFEFRDPLLERRDPRRPRPPEGSPSPSTATRTGSRFETDHRKTRGQIACSVNRLSQHA